MATLAEQVQGERMVRVALSMIAQPNDGASGLVLARVGGVETLRLIESDDPMPGLARADALRWRERLAARIRDARIPLHVLQGILRHASMETTRGHLHPDDRHLASAAEQANAFLSTAEERKHPRRSGPATRRL